MSLKSLNSSVALGALCSAAVLAVRMDDRLPTHAAKIEENNAAIRQCIEQADALMAVVDGERREPTAEEQARIDELHTEVENLQADNVRRNRQIALKEAQAAPLARATDADPADDDDRSAAVTPPARNAAARARPVVPGGQFAVADRGDVGMWGWESRSQFMQAVHKARSGNVAELLQRKASVNTEIGEQGAFAVPPTIAAEIMQKAFDSAPIASRCDVVDISGNRYTGMMDEDEPYSTDGIQVYWVGEREAITPSSLKLDDYEIKLNKLAALVPVTNEALADAAQLEGLVRSKAPLKMGEALDAAVIAGNGVKKPQGMIDSDCALQVAKVGGQTADTVVYENIKSIWTRVHAPCRQNGRGIWIANPDVEDILFDLEFPGDGRPIYIAGNSLAGQPNTTLLGREIVYSQHAPVVGDHGDIGFYDLKEYRVIRRVGANPKIDTSIHVYFDQDVSAFRFIMRVAGQPKWSRPVDQKNSAVDRSCFVTVADRA